MACNAEFSRNALRLQKTLSMSLLQKKQETIDKKNDKNIFSKILKKILF